jgi:hypothetical protein
VSRRTATRGLLSVALASILVYSLAGPAHAAVTTVPYRVDMSNEAGWWRPIDEFNGRVYVAYNAWGSMTAGGRDDTHTVYVAKREPNGSWSRGCLKNSAGGCVVYPDDPGHRQPTIAVDGDGYIHVFAGMHQDSWQYFRSRNPGDVGSLEFRSQDMPEGGRFTYPVATRGTNGNVYLIVRKLNEGRFYRWDNTSNRWGIIGTFANHASANYVVYPDDIIADANGHLHIIWEWAYNGGQSLRHLGSYLRFNPGNGLYFNAAGQQVAVPATIQSPVVYQPLGPGERSTDQSTSGAPGVQSAKIALHPVTLRPIIGYRYREVQDGPFRVKVAEWDGSQWQRSTVYAGAYDTTAAIDVTAHGDRMRVYYAKADTLTGDQVFAATRVYGSWQEVSLLPGVRVERLSVIRRLNIDHFYLCAPDAQDLYYGTRAW